MQVLAKSPECYIQQCGHCGSVLKYSECDIHISDVPFYTKGGEEWTCGFDSILCPCCDNIIEAKRIWIVEAELIKKFLDNIK